MKCEPYDHRWDTLSHQREAFCLKCGESHGPYLASLPSALRPPTAEMEQKRKAAELDRFINALGDDGMKRLVAELGLA